MPLPILTIIILITLTPLTHFLDVPTFSKTMSVVCQPIYNSQNRLIDQYNFSIIENNMEIQTTPFTHIDETTAQYLSSHSITMQGPCSLSLNGPANHTLRLISSVLILERPGELPVYWNLTFDAKFQTIYQVQRNVQSAKMGIRFYNDEQKQLKVFFEGTFTEKWAYTLGKIINQKGFHEMFKPIKKLGKGNFATVYEAERITDKAKFAVKAFSKEACFSTKNGKESLINQLAVLRQLNKGSQSNILKLEGVYESQNSIYVIMELLTGKTLFEVIEDRKGRFTHSQIKRIISGLLKGLHHMHQNRIMHRDIKPQNIMLRGDSLDPVIVDFGLATNVDQKQYIFFRCGTPGYVAPEIVNLTRCEHIQPICDVFSLGAIFHILLSRKALFAGSKYEEVYNSNKQFNICLQGDHFTGVHPDAKQLLGKMLILQPNDRVSTGEALSHRYFCAQIAEQCHLKMGSPVLTDTCVSFKDDKRRKTLLC